MNVSFCFRLMLALSTTTLASIAQPKIAASQTAQAEQSHRCEKEVREYVEAMQFIRTAAGANIGDRVAAGIGSEDHIRKVVQEQGYCAAAQVVRQRLAKR